MFLQLILILVVLIPLLAILLDSQVGKALASRLEKGGGGGREEEAVEEEEEEAVHALLISPLLPLLCDIY